MNVSDIQTLFAYNRWANQRLFGALEKLNERQFIAPTGSSFPSIRQTVFHVFFAEWLWLKRWQGESPQSSLPDPDLSSATADTLSPGLARECQTLAELKSFSNSIDEERQRFLSSLQDEVLQAPFAFKDMAGTPYSMPLLQAMQHLVNHSTYHRGQIVTMLRQIGAEPVSLDMLYFFRETAH